MTRTDARHLTTITHSHTFTGVDTEEGRWGAAEWITTGAGRYEGSDVLVPVVNPAGASATLRLNMFDPIVIVTENTPY